VNNVGFNIRKKVLDYTDDDYSRIMSTNLDSAFVLCKALHGMLKQTSASSSMQEGPASVVNVGSVAGKYLRTSSTIQGCGTMFMIMAMDILHVAAGGNNVAIRSGVVYARTKAAMTQMTYNMACEWAADNIRSRPHADG